MLREVTEQAGHVCESRAVDQVSSIALLSHQACVHQFLEVKRQRRGGHIQLLTQGTRREARWACHDQCAEHTKTHRLGQGGERFDDFSFFYFSMIVESWKKSTSSRLCGERCPVRRRPTTRSKAAIRAPSMTDPQGAELPPRPDADPCRSRLGKASDGAHLVWFLSSVFDPRPESTWRCLARRATGYWLP